MSSVSASPVVYPVTRGWRIFLQLSALGGFALITIPSLAWVKKNPEWTPGEIIAVLLALSVSCLIGAWAARIKRYRIEIRPDRIRYCGAWSFRELNLANISGYRILPTQYVATLLIVPSNKRYRKISTALCYERKEEMLSWIAEHLTDLDRQEVENELTEIITDTSLGSDENERLARLAVAKRYVLPLNIVACCAAFWAFFFPRPYDLVIGTMIALPVIGLALVAFSHGLVRLDGKPKSAYPNVASALIVPPLVLTLRAFLDWHLLSWSDTWPTLAVLTAIAVVLVLAIARDARRRWALFGTITCSALYVYGTATYLNCRHDRSDPLVYESRVSERHISKGKHTSYHVTLAPFVDDEPSREIDVLQKTYERLREGDQVQIGVFEGLLGIPWFLIR
jgi:hypothetical protein